MKPTTFRNVLSFIFVGAIVGSLIPSIYENITSTYIPVSTNTVIALLLLNLALLYWIVIFKNRLKDARDKNQDILKRKSPPHPLVAARTVALAFAGSRAASLILGFYLGAILNFLPNLDLSPIKSRISVSLAIIALSAVLLALSLWLEKICRIKDSDDKPGDNASFA
jgi:uncharacterized membrane protein